MSSRWRPGLPYRWTAKPLAWRVPRPDAANALERDPGEEPRRRTGMFGKRRQSDLRVRQTPEGLCGTALVHPRHPLHDEVLEQPTLVSRGRWYGERDARVAAEVPSASADPAASPRRSRPLDPDPSSRHLRSSVRVECDHVPDRVALEKLPSRLGKRIPATGECYFARITLRWIQGHTPVEERHPRKRPHLTLIARSC